MRLENLLKIGFVIFVGMLFLNCSNDSDTPEDTNQKTTIENEVKSGVWRVAEYLDDGVDETYHYEGYEFTFKVGGVLTATNGLNSYEGTWSVTSDSDDDSQSDYDFVIFFTGPEAFQELSDDWDILSHSLNIIDLYDVSGGDGTTDYLTFQKI